MERDTRRRRPEEPERRPAPQRRRRNKRSPLSNSMLYIVMVCAVSIVLAAVGWSLANDMLALNKDKVTATIVVDDENDFGSVVDQLKDNDIIKYKGLFRLFSALSGGSDKIAQGSYLVDTDMDYRAILNSLGSGSSSRVEVSVTIQEGLTVRQIFELLEKEGVSTVEKLNDMAANHDYAFSFLEDIPLGDPNRLEGYLFPDTYNFYMGEDPKYVINKMLVNFDSKVDDSMRQKIADKGYTIQELLTVASMIEKETDGEDRGKIASVIYNRLNNPGASAGTNGYLQIDATLAYLNGGKVPTEADKSIDSPYNTYLYPGLPPGPIANPGIESILAAINPSSTSYYYYVLGDDDRHHFFNTYREMQNFMSTQAMYSNS